MSNDAPSAVTTVPEAAPPVVDRDAFEAALAEQVVREKMLTRITDQVSAMRRRLPMVEVDNYVFQGPDGPVTLVELFGDHYLLMVQNFMFAPDWEEGCPSCTWAVDNLPANIGRLADAGIAFAIISQAPIASLERWRTKHGWSHTWVSSGETSYHDDWGWTMHTDEYDGPVPGHSYYLLHEGRPYLTYMDHARGTEAIMPTTAIQDRTCYGRQQDWEDSPEGWPQYPTYG